MALALALSALALSSVARAQPRLPAGPAPTPLVPRDAAEPGADAAGNAALPPPSGTLEGLEGRIDPGTYVIGPGDRLLVMLWGLRELQIPVEVSPEGRLIVPRVGVFDAAGTTLGELRGTVERRLHVVYPTLTGGLLLVRPRSFLVHVTGAVLRPGAYPATPLTRVSHLVERAGGPLPGGSLRRVQIRRVVPRAATLTADLARYALLGELDGDPTLLDGDTVYVPPRQTEVEVSGAVRRPGRYELVAGRDVRELLELCGGPSADRSSLLPVRISTRGGADRVVAQTLSLDRSDAPLHDGDRVHVPSLGDLGSTVVVEGAVVGLPGSAEPPPATVSDRRMDAAVSATRDVSVPLPFVEGDRVTDLLTKVGGLQPWADGASAYLLRPIHGGTGGTGGDGAGHADRRRLPVDLPAIRAHRVADVEVQAGDTVVVPSRRESVIVGGAVQRPGLYQFTPGLRVADYLTLAGGPTRTGDVGGTRIVGRSGTPTRAGASTPVEPGDAIAVPEKSMTVAEWVQITLIIANLAVATTAVVLSQTH